MRSIVQSIVQIEVHFDQYDLRKLDKVDMIMWPMHDDQVVVAMVTR